MKLKRIKIDHVPSQNYSQHFILFLPTQSSLFQACITDNEVCYLSNLENQALILDTC